jgi:hypothetical protein
VNFVVVLQTSALRGPTLSTRIEAYVYMKLFWRCCWGGKVKGTHILWLLRLLVAGEYSKLLPLDSAITSFCFLFLFSLVRLNGKQPKN